MSLQYPALLNEARRLLAANQFSQCYETCQHLLSIRKNDPETLMILASIDFSGGHRDRAIDQMRRFVRLYPKHTVGRNYLGYMLDENGRMREAVVQYDKVLRREPDNTEAIAGKARALDRDGQPEKAMKLLEPRCAAGTLTPAMALVYATCAMNSKNYELAVEVARPHAENESQHGGDLRSAAGLWYVLGQCYERLEKIEESFNAYANANSVGAPEYDPDERDREIDALIEVFSKDNLARLPRAECDSEQPVFIACQPRSGSTLIERIIGSHPMAHPAGEFSVLINITDKMAFDIGSLDPYPRCALDMDQSDVNMLSERYMTALKQLSPKSTRIINKHLANWQCLGLVELLFPRARAIDLRRERIDQSLACYFIDLGSKFRYSYRLEHIGRERCTFERLMEHWHDVLSIPILRVSYEDVVADQEAWSRKMIDFLGLQWNDAVLAFHETAGKKGSDRPTLSYAQVRQPIYKSSVGRAEKFRPYIGELLDALGEERTEPRL